jgi:hypothetical protein
VRALLPAICVLAAACGSPSSPSSSTPQDALPVETTTAHYVFHASVGDVVQPDTQEQYHAWVLEQFGVSVDRPIHYYKYRDRSQMQQLTGKLTNGWADPNTSSVHSIFPWDNHEVVHVVTALIGRPSDFFNEGIAVAMQTDPQRNVWEPMWNGRSIHSWASEYERTHQLPSLAAIVETVAFRALDDTRSYPVAGSVVRFLLDALGMGRMQAFFRATSRDAGAADIDREFSAAFGMSLCDAEIQWHGFLAAR